MIRKFLIFTVIAVAATAAIVSPLWKSDAAHQQTQMAIELYLDGGRRSERKRTKGFDVAGSHLFTFQNGKIKNRRVSISPKPDESQVANLKATDLSVTSTEIYFRTDEPHIYVSRLEQVGARALSPLTLRDWGDEAAYFADPDGNVIVVARSVQQ